MRRVARHLAAATALLVAPAALAQDLSGAWEMDTNVELPEEGPVADCVYTGECQMAQDGNDLSGTVALTLLSGPEECPAEMLAALSGFVQGDSVGGSLSGQLGEAQFQGQRSNSFVGTFLVEEGPFAGATGTWLAQRPGDGLLAIPTTTGIGLALLALALFSAGAWLLRSQ